MFVSLNRWLVRFDRLLYVFKLKLGVLLDVLGQEIPLLLMLLLILHRPQQLPRLHPRAHRLLQSQRHEVLILHQQRLQLHGLVDEGAEGLIGSRAEGLALLGEGDGGAGADPGQACHTWIQFFDLAASSRYLHRLLAHDDILIGFRVLDRFLRELEVPILQLEIHRLKSVKAIVLRLELIPRISQRLDEDLLWAGQVVNGRRVTIRAARRAFVGGGVT